MIESNEPAIEQAKKRIEYEIDEGLQHGFFEFSVHCEIKNGSRRVLTVRAGKTHLFNISKEELP